MKQVPERVESLPNAPLNNAEEAQQTAPNAKATALPPVDRVFSKIMRAEDAPRPKVA